MHIEDNSISHKNIILLVTINILYINVKDKTPEKQKKNNKFEEFLLKSLSKMKQIDLF